MKCSFKHKNKTWRCGLILTLPPPVSAGLKLPCMHLLAPPAETSWCSEGDLAPLRGRVSSHNNFGSHRKSYGCDLTDTLACITANPLNIFIILLIIMGVISTITTWH